MNLAASLFLWLSFIAVSLASVAPHVVQRDDDDTPNPTGAYGVREDKSFGCKESDFHCVYMDKYGETFGSYTPGAGKIPCRNVDQGTGDEVPIGYGICQYFNGITTAVYCSSDDWVDIDFYYDYFTFTLHGNVWALWGSKSGTAHSGERYTDLPGDNLSVKCKKDEAWPGNFQ